MKKLNNFLTNAPHCKIFIVSFVFMYFLGLISSCFINNLNKFNYNIILIFISIMFALFMTLSMYSCRLSDKFWKAAKEFEIKLDNIENKEELDNLFKNNFQKLKELSQGNPHYYEIQRLYSIILTKQKYIN